MTMTPTNTKNSPPEPLVLLDAIVDELDGREWDADTIHRIANMLHQVGYQIRDVEDREADEGVEGLK